VAADYPRLGLPPPWLGNLLVFGLLVALVAAWFLVQTRQAQRSFLADSSAHARLVGDAVGLHARGAVLAQELGDGLLSAFLGSSARFVDYLDGIEPFRAEELTAFAAEAGLALIRVVRPDGAVQGPAGGVPLPAADCSGLERPRLLPDRQVLLYGIPRSGGGCVWVAMAAGPLEALRAAVGLPQALAAVRQLPGMVAVTLRGQPDPGRVRAADAGAPEVVIRRLDGRPVASARVPVAGAELRLDLDAAPLLRQQQRLWWEFAGLLAVLLPAGGLGTWLLYRHQRAHDRRLQAVERQLSQQREEAGLGRAAAGIAHEIRNPLNALAMGLQRLQLEVEDLAPDHQRLLAAMGEALRRANASVTGLLDYARAYRPLLAPVALEQLLDEQCSLFQGRLAELGVTPRRRIVPVTPVPGDADLLRQVLDNLLRTALEALPSGGDLSIELGPVPGGVQLDLTNTGLALAPEEVERMLEPWFTTKVQGTGLGLAIARRMIAAHGGRLTLAAPAPGQLRVRVWLPARPVVASTAEPGP
jgi:two-component system sensor histidine kinase HydH